MSRNIRDIFEDEENLLGLFNKSLKSKVENGFTFFERSKLGNPVVVEDELANKWLELNYLYSTGFSPGFRPGVGEIGGDIRSLEEIDGQDYLTVPLGLLDSVIRALGDFRDVEEVCGRWEVSKEKYYEETVNLIDTLESVGWEGIENAFAEDMHANIGFQYTGLPSKEFVKRIQDLTEELKREKGSSENHRKAYALADSLRRELAPISEAVDGLKDIRKYHKTFPHIDKDMIRINSPAASGGLSLHTHPGYDDPYMCLPSSSDLMIIASQSGTIPVYHLGGGETQGEHYIMHVPKKIFFKRTKDIVDQKNAKHPVAIMKIKQEVLDINLEEIMKDEILGFKVDGKTEYKTAILSPLVTREEFGKHKGYFDSIGKNGYDLGVKDMILDVGSGYGLYVPEVKEILSENLGALLFEGE